MVALSTGLPGTIPASFRGVGFHVPDASSTAGRRLVESLFPGIDRAAYDDFGLTPEAFRLDGVLLGEDYVVQAKRLKAAFMRPGPGTLMHPWLGPMTVLLPEPAEITFSDAELFAARFSATFVKIPPNGIAALVSSGTALVQAAADLAGAALAIVRLPAVVVASAAAGFAALRTARVLSDIWASTVPDRRAATGTITLVPVRLNGAAGAAVASLAGAMPSSDADRLATRISTFGDAVLAAIPDLSSASAVAPAAGAASVSGLTLRDGFDVLLHVAGQALQAAGDAPSAADRAMLLGAAGAHSASAAEILARLDFDSRQDALEVRAVAVDHFDALLVALDPLLEINLSTGATLLRRALAATRLAAIADINEAIGRLPSLLVVATDRPVDAFAVAHHLFGDDPSRVEAGYLSIVSRNPFRHPAEMPAGRIEAVR